MLQILYVDDEIDLLTIGKSFIEMKGEFSVDTADSASAAMERLNSKAYDVIVSDYQMPVMDGIEFLEHLRQRKPDVPVLIITGYPSIPNAASAMLVCAVHGPSGVSETPPNVLQG